MRYPVTCPNDCTIETICREDVKKHMDEDCPLQRVACRYNRIGCTEQVRRQNLERHLEEEKDRHLQLAMDSVVELTLKLDEMAIKVEELTAKSDATTDEEEEEDDSLALVSAPLEYIVGYRESVQNPRIR